MQGRGALGRKAVLLALVVAALGGLGLAAIGDSATIRREVRLALGLPKLWHTQFDIAADRYQPLPCPGRAADPLVLVIGGQSNAANRIAEALPPDTNRRTFMFWDGACYKAQSPVIGSTGGMGAIWPLLADRLQQATGRDVVIISGAVRGTQIGDWVDQRSRYMARLADQVRAARGRGMDPDMVLWIQGETDAAVMLAGADYVAQQHAVIEGFRRSGATDGATPWVIYFSTRCLHRPNSGPEIEAALHDLVDPPGDALFAGPSLTAFGDEWRSDTCHLNAKGAARVVDETVAVLEREGLI